MSAVVIGYGNTLLGDDAVGPELAEAVAAQGLDGVQALAVPQLTPELAEVVSGARLAVFLDASAQPGVAAVEVVPVRPAGQAASLGHTSDPGVLLALAEAVYGRCPPAWMVRVPAERFALGAGLSPGTRRAAEEALRAVLRLVGAGPSDAEAVLGPSPGQ